MTPEEATHHEWLNEMKQQHPKVIDRSARSPPNLKSANYEVNDNTYGKDVRRQIITECTVLLLIGYWLNILSYCIISEIKQERTNTEPGKWWQ